MSVILDAAELESQIKNACKRFYTLFDTFPEKIEVSDKRGWAYDPLPRHIRFTVLQSDPTDFWRIPPDCPNSRVKTVDADISVTFGRGLGWNDFRLHHRIIANNPQGFLTADDLEMNVDLLKRMIHFKGYTARVLSDDSSDERPYDLISINQGNWFLQWAVSKELYKQDLHCIKWELDAQLHKFAQLDQAQQKEQEPAPVQPPARGKQQEAFEFGHMTCFDVHVDLSGPLYETIQRIFEQQYLQYRANPTYLFASAETYQALEQSIEEYLNTHMRVHCVKSSEAKRLPCRYVAVINQSTGTLVHIVPFPGIEAGRLIFGFVKW